MRLFYLETVRDPECAVASDSAIAGDPHRIFRIGSLGKLFVELAVLRMEAEGRFDLSRSVREVSKLELPPEYGAVTLRDLLENRSGLPREFLNPWNPLDWHVALMCGLAGTHIYADFESRANFAAELSSSRSRSFVREREPQYSNMGFALLTLCMEDMTGRNIDEIVHDEVVVPLGLDDTSFCPVGEAVDRLTPPCAGKLPWMVRRGATVPEHRLGPALRGMGSLFSSAADCQKAFRAYWRLIDSSLSERALADLADGEDVHLLKVRTLADGRRILYRFGMIYGGGSYVAFDPSTRRFLVILRNVTSWPAAEDFEMSARFFAQPAKPVRGLSMEEPAPGRGDGRIYWYVPEGIDLSRPAPLLVFLHGGDRSSPDSAPGSYFSDEKRWLMPDVAHAPFIVAAPSAPHAPDGSRWNRDGVSRIIDATIAAAERRFSIDRDRIFLGGHSMGGFGAYHLGQILADRFAGVWLSAGAWWEADFRAFLGTPVYIQHGALDCSPRPGYSGGHNRPRRHHWCGVSFARAAHELMQRGGVEHVYDEHAEGHSLSFPAAKAAMRRFFDWSRGRRRDPYARRSALVTPCGTMHPDVERVTRSRWLELLEQTDGEIAVDSIVLHGPDVASTDADLVRQTYSLSSRYWDGGARIVAENMGGNRFRAATENVRRFAIYLSPQMGDLSRPFTVELEGGPTLMLKAEPVAGESDYTARIVVEVGA